MRQAFLELRIKYDRIIIDCPPILPVSDPAMYSSHADAAIYVVKSDATSVHQIKAGLSLLERVNAPIIGIILNQLDSRKASKYGEYGYGGYYETYDSDSLAG
jgi:Mrp family chromosome partitioning ATPase